jgi:predicted secreted protein
MRSSTRPFVRVGLVSTIVCAVGAATAQAQTTLRWKLKDGETLNYTTDMVQKQKASVMGMEIETTMTQGMGMSWKVGAVKDGKAEVTQTIDSFRQKMESPFAQFEFDSKEGKEPEGPIGQLIGPIMKALVGAEFTLKLDPQGEVSDVKVSQKLVDSLKQNPALAQLGSMFSEDGLKNMVQQGGQGFPKESVEKGNSWTKNVELKMPFGTMKMENTFTYEGPETKDDAKLEKIAMKAKITIEPAEDSPIALKIKSGDVAGTIYFDNVAGRIRRSETKQNMVMEITANGMVIETAVDQTMTMKLTEKE